MCSGRWAVATPWAAVITTRIIIRRKFNTVWIEFNRILLLRNSTAARARRVSSREAGLLREGSADDVVWLTCLVFGPAGVARAEPRFQLGEIIPNFTSATRLFSYELFTLTRKKRWTWIPLEFVSSFKGNYFRANAANSSSAVLLRGRFSWRSFSETRSKVTEVSLTCSLLNVSMLSGCVLIVSVWCWCLVCMDLSGTRCSSVLKRRRAACWSLSFLSLFKPCRSELNTHARLCALMTRYYRCTSSYRMVIQLKIVKSRHANVISTANTSSTSSHKAVIILL